MNLTDLRNLTRTYLNEPIAAFWSDAELDRLINVGCKKYHARIKNVSRNHFTTRVTFETTANQEYYQLPSNLKDLRLVAIVDGDSSESFLTKAYWPNPDRFTESGLVRDGLSGESIPGQYWIVGKSIRLLPRPSSILTVRLYYEARQVALAAGSDVPTFDEDYHDLAAKWAAIEAASKDRDKRPELESMIVSREQDLLQDVYHRVNPPVGEAEGFLEGIY